MGQVSDHDTRALAMVEADLKPSPATAYLSQLQHYCPSCGNVWNLTACCGVDLSPLESGDDITGYRECDDCGKFKPEGDGRELGPSGLLRFECWSCGEAKRRGP